MSSHYRMPVDPTADNNPHSYAIQIVGHDHRVLEVGCSVGHVTEHLVAAGNTVVGVEIDAAAAEEARVHAERVHVADLDATELSSVESGPFDVIVLGDVLEHLRDPQRVLADLVPLLEPDGRLVISVPNVAHIDLRLLLLEGRWTYQETGLLDRTHLRWFTKSSLRELLTAVGFTATRLERVVINPFTSGLPVTEGLHHDAVIEFIEADPEARTFQFVVEARRTDTGNTVENDVLADATIDWPRIDADRHRLEALRAHAAGVEQHNRALQTELDAWHNSKLTRVAAPARSLWARVRERNSR